MRERCPRCGKPWGFPTARLAWTAVILLAVWAILQRLDYGTVRVEVYALVARGAEAFLHPAWGIALLVVAVGLLIAARRRVTLPPVAPSMAPSIQLRAEPPGKITVVIEGARGAMADEHVVERDLEAENRVANGFDALARRTAAFSNGAGSAGWSRDQIEDAQREIYALGLAIGNDILGGSSEVADSLFDLPGDHLQLSVKRELSGIPWELMVARRGGEFLWQLFSVTRQLRDVKAPKTRPRRHGPPCRLLLIANPEAGIPGRDLPAAEEEAGDILELGATRPELLRVIRKSPRSADELRALLEEGYDALHFAGHTGASDEIERGWTLADGVPVNPGELFSRGTPTPRLVFANACSSNPSARGGAVADAARTLMLAGIPAYLCTLAELHDEGSAVFSASFYRAILGGATLGRAVTAARAALMGRHPVTWANYALYGDPTFALCGASPAPDSAKKTSP